MDNNIQPRCQTGGERHVIEQITKGLIGRRVLYGKDHSGIEQSALAARLLQDDLSVDAVSVAAALLTFGSTSLVVGKERELGDHTILMRLHEDVRFGAGLRELVEKGIVAVSEVRPRVRRYKFLPQELCETISLAIPKAATRLLALETYYGRLHALGLCFLVEQIWKAAAKEGEEVAFPMMWLAAGIATLDGDLNQNLACAIISDLVDVGAIDRKFWVRPASSPCDDKSIGEGAAA